MNLYGYFAIVGLSLAALLLAAKSPKAALYVVIFLAPWQGLGADFGLRVTAHQIFLFMLLVFSLMRVRVFGWDITQVRSRSLALAFVGYAVVWSLAQWPLLPDAAIAGGGMRAPKVRALVQIFMFLFTISPVFIAPMAFKTSRDLIRAGKVYVWSAVSLAIVGWVQLAVWYFTGWNPTPIGLMDSLLGGMAEAREGMFEVASLPIYRMNSLGGEPKDLGASLVVALVLIQTVLLFGRNSTHRLKAVVVWAFLVVSAAATMSTTALYLWILGTVAVVAGKAIVALRSARRQRSVGAIIAGCVSLLLLFGASASYLASSDESVQDELSVSGIIYARTVGRESNLLEDFDEAIIGYLADNPGRLLFGVGLGNVHLHADSYLAPDSADFASSTAFSAKAGYLRLVSELGLAGFFLFGYWIWLSATQRSSYLSGDGLPGIDSYLSVLGSAAAILYLASATVAPQSFLTIGAVAAARRILPEAASTP